jgi:hypothetical protein
MVFLYLTIIKNLQEHWIDHFEVYISLSKVKYEPREDVVPSIMRIAQQINIKLCCICFTQL